MKGWRSWFIGIVIAAALIGIVLHLGELRNFAALAGKAKPIWLLLALAFQLTTYASLAMSWQAILRKAEGRPRRLLPLVRVAFSKLFTDQALPTAGMGGNVLLVDQLVAIGASRGTAVAALLISIRGFYAAYLFYALAALFLLWLHGRATPLMVGVVTSFVLVALAIPALALWLRRRGSRPLPSMVEHIRPIRQLLETVAEAPARLIGDRALLVRVTLFQALIFAADILTLHACLEALGMETALSTALIAFILASIAVTLGPIPLGLGSFEVVCTSTLHLLGIPLEAAFAATLLLRFLILWLPLAPGMFLMRKIVGRKGQPPRQEMNPQGKEQD